MIIYLAVTPEKTMMEGCINNSILLSFFLLKHKKNILPLIKDWEKGNK